MRNGARAAGLAAALASAAIAQPNDPCSSATEISGYSSFGFDTRQATTDGAPNAACQANGTDQIYKDVWFCWTAPAAGPVVFTTCGDGNTFDTRIAVYDGCSPCPEGSGGILGCSDDEPGCGVQSRVAFRAVRGRSYLLRVGGTSQVVGGTGTFRLSPPPCPCDWNGDGHLNSQDFFDFLSDFFALGPFCPPCVDFNGDGLGNVQDFFDFLTCFFAPPAGC